MTATSPTVTTIKVSWSAFPNATYYEVWSSTQSISTGRTKIASPLAGAGISYSNTGVTANTLYYYWLKACDTRGCSTFSTGAPVGPTIRRASQDFNTFSGILPTLPTGIWSDGTTMWVVDKEKKKIYAYKMSDKTRDATKDFNTLDPTTTFPRGIWSNGTTMWVPDFQDEKIYAYNMKTKAFDSNNGFNTLKAAGNTDPMGIWSDGTTLWVADSVDNKLYAYTAYSK